MSFNVPLGCELGYGYIYERYLGKLTAALEVLVVEKNILCVISGEYAIVCFCLSELSYFNE